MSLWFVLLVSQSRAADDGFRSLVRGDDPAQFEIVGLNRDQITMHAGEIRISGKQDGYLATQQSFKNYTLTFDWTLESPANGRRKNLNAGLLVHGQAPDTHAKGSIWPQGIEVQLWYKEYASFFGLARAGFTTKSDDRAGRDKALRPPGEWNHQTVICHDGEITLSVNDTAYATGTRAMPDAGRIGLMYEGSPIRFRELKIKVER